MDTKRTLTILVTTVLMLLGTALPVLATEAPDTKSQLIMRSPHHIVGSLILLVVALFATMAVANALRQLRGKREQADGRFRWR